MESPAPLTPPDCDLRNFEFMPLDVIRLRDSDLVVIESAEAFRAAVLLWCASWHQIPAASLPDDDRVLANLSGFGRVVKEWQKVKDGALRGWVKCSDGRIYHPVIAEKANEAFNRKLEQGWRTECARIKKHNERNKEDPERQLAYPTFEDYLNKLSSRPESVPRDKPKSPTPVAGKNTSNRQGEGQGHGQGNNNKTASSGTPEDVGQNGEGCAAPLYVQLAVELRKAGVSITSAHPNVLAWSERGLTVAQAKEAVEIARQRKPEGSIAANYLLGIVEDILNPPAPREKTETAWWTSEAATIAKGRELGINPGIGESMECFRGRIRSEIEKRKGKAA